MIKDRLMRIVHDCAGGQPSVFAKKAGIPQSTFHNYIKGRIPNAEHLYPICDRFSVNLNWLIAGKGEPYIQTKPEGIYQIAENVVPFGPDEKVAEIIIDKMGYNFDDDERKEAFRIIKEWRRLQIEKIDKNLISETGPNLMKVLINKG